MLGKSKHHNEVRKNTTDGWMDQVGRKKGENLLRWMPMFCAAAQGARKTRRRCKKPLFPSTYWLACFLDPFSPFLSFFLFFFLLLRHKSRISFWSNKEQKCLKDCGERKKEEAFYEQQATEWTVQHIHRLGTFCVSWSSRALSWSNISVCFCHFHKYTYNSQTDWMSQLHCYFSQ